MNYVTKMAVALLVMQGVTSQVHYKQSSCNDLAPSGVTAPESSTAVPYNFTITPLPFRGGHRVKGEITTSGQPFIDLFIMTACKGCNGFFCGDAEHPAVVYVCDKGFGMTSKTQASKYKFVFYWTPITHPQMPVQFIASMVFNESLWWNNVYSNEIIWNYGIPHLASSSSMNLGTSEIMSLTFTLSFMITQSLNRGVLC